MAEGRTILLYAAGWLLSFGLLMTGAVYESVSMMASAIVLAVGNVAVLEWRRRS